MHIHQFIQKFNENDIILLCKKTGVTFDSIQTEKNHIILLSVDECNKVRMPKNQMDFEGCELRALEVEERYNRGLYRVYEIYEKMYS